MIGKRTVITALVGLNLFLAAALVINSTSLPAAYAQRAGAAGNYVAVTCRSDKDYDVLYITDLGQRKLHCFVPRRDRSGAVDYGGGADLASDFNR